MCKCTYIIYEIDLDNIFMIVFLFSAPSLSLFLSLSLCSLRSALTFYFDFKSNLERESLFLPLSVQFCTCIQFIGTVFNLVKKLLAHTLRKAKSIHDPSFTLCIVTVCIFVPAGLASGYSGVRKSTPVSQTLHHST